MKILIVNGYIANSTGMEAFSEFQWAIKKVITIYISYFIEKTGFKFTKRVD